jgi:hypothetical protein
MKYSSSFTHDLNFGELAEDWVKNIFSNGCKVEVKSDTMAHITGNVFIEFESRGKPSGIATTDADYWVYKINEINFAIIFDVIRLKEKLRYFYINNMYIKNGGDNNTSKGFLIPIIELLKK